ncbi:MAG: topoisomerase DNA-binding C4 zinc finger domain-containing protein [Gammaproteobacteria bacterium]|jgi:ssDNA-binding Zn-finger/Zn-ribbon topoisomerase 1|nr:DNA topoisomerase I [Gammaproteobacteria bacterium]MDP6095004.1 topoisomerase DNA-binding C4 zinc finger domain-containing protein [Gammaproteobacteria bacterium]HJO11588.1 topoisomerase DNA-binding C4 zinc finger domain-containing protein [Gammaproteobacteria bacterium]|tara:strand:+ start:313 stop:777 length:465 start_codon:yes stop_codon:yes gene_type:complete
MSESQADLFEEKTYYCALCKKPLRRIEGKMGPFWSCTGYPDCKSTLYDRGGVPSLEMDEHYRCPLCTRKMVRADKEKGDYWFCSGYNKGCKVTLNDLNGMPEPAYRCKSCQQLLVRRNGKNGVFWGCSQFPKCTSTYRDDKGKPDFDIFTAEDS